MDDLPRHWDDPIPDRPRFWRNLGSAIGWRIAIAAAQLGKGLAVASIVALVSGTLVAVWWGIGMLTGG